MNCLTFIWITLLLHTTAEKVQSVRFFILPSKDSPCPGEYTGEPCFTLADFSKLNNINPTRIIGSDVILDLQPGVHETDSTSLSTSGINSFKLTGTNASFRCDVRPRLFLSSIVNAQITGINFLNCPDIEITSVDNLIVQDCSFRSSSLTLRNVNATVNRCNFSNIFRSTGGAILIDGGVTTIKNSSFVGNSREAVYARGVESIFVFDSMFDAADRDARGVYLLSPRDSVVFLRCNFTRLSRRRTDGGAVHIFNGMSANISFTECNFMDNGGSRGGAVYVSTFASMPLSLNVSFTGCNFTRNSASSGGGAFWAATSTTIEVSFSKCNFIDNQGTGFSTMSSSFIGGAVTITSLAVASNVLPISISECQFTNNMVAASGGAVHLGVENTRILITRSYFTDNRLSRGTSVNSGGAVYISGNDNIVSVIGGAFMNNTVLQGSGGALFSAGERTNLSFVDVLFHSNSAASRLGTRNRLTHGYGGAVYMSGDDNQISIKRGAFVSNRVVQGGGGALYSTGQRTNFLFDDVLFHNNSAAFCGALEVDQFFHDSVNFTRSTFTSNSATGGRAPNLIYGGSGAICIRNASISVVNSTFSNNSAVGNAGVMHVEGSSVEIIDSEFKNNAATLDGGVVYTKLSPSSFTIQQSTFSDNKAGDDGGVMYMGRAGSRIDVNESSFSFNHAVDRGGALVVLGSTLNIVESSFSDNTATRGDVINTCIGEISTDKAFEDNTLRQTSSRTACISYNNLPLLPTEMSTIMATQTEESATTRSMVRRTAPIIMPPQTITPQTTAITPEAITEETTTDTPSRVGTTLTPQTGASTVAQTDSASTLGATTQHEQQSTMTTNTLSESSTTIIPPEESTTTAAAKFGTESPQSESTSTPATDTIGIQTEASTTIVLPETEGVGIPISTLSQTASTGSPPQTESTSAATDNSDTTSFQIEPSTMPETEDIHTTDLPRTETMINTTITESTTTVAAEISTTSDYERIASTGSSQSEAPSTATAAMDTSTTGHQTKASTTIALPVTKEVVHITTLPQTEIPTSTKASSTTATATQADTTDSIETSTAKGTVDTTQTEAATTTTDLRLTTAKEDTTEKLPSTAANELSTTQSDSLRGSNNAAGAMLFSTSLLMISVTVSFISALQI